MLHPLRLFPSNVEANLIGARCAECLHLVDLVEGLCLAFPEGIPKDLMQDRILHDQPYPGDHGIRYERAPESQLRPQ